MLRSALLLFLVVLFPLPGLANGPLRSIVIFGNEKTERATILKIIGVEPQTLAKWACQRSVDLPYVRVGRCVRYRLSELQRFIERNTVGAQD